MIQEQASMLRELTRAFEREPRHQIYPNPSTHSKLLELYEQLRLIAGFPYEACEAAIELVEDSGIGLRTIQGRFRIDIPKDFSNGPYVDHFWSVDDFGVYVDLSGWQFNRWMYWWNRRPNGIWVVYPEDKLYRRFVPGNTLSF